MTDPSDVHTLFTVCVRQTILCMTQLHLFVTVLGLHILISNQSVSVPSVRCPVMDEERMSPGHQLMSVVFDTGDWVTRRTFGP